MERVRVELKPNGKAALVATPGMIAIEAPATLAGPWELSLDHLAEVVWLSPFGARFAARGLTGSPTPDVAPAMVDTRWMDADVTLAFTEPQRVPYRRGRTLWGRSIVTWRTRGPRDPRLFFPPAAVRAGRATSLVLRAASDTRELKEALEHSGLDFPELASGPH